RVFAADPEGPAVAGLARARGQADHVGHAVVVSDPGAAALHITEEAIPGITDPAGDRRQRFDVRMVSTSDKRRIGRGAAGVAPIIVALDAEHPGGDLIIAADLAAREPAADVLGALRGAGGGRPGLGGPQAAGIAADIASGPAVRRRHH